MSTPPQLTAGSPHHSHCQGLWAVPLLHLQIPTLLASTWSFLLPSCPLASFSRGLEEGPSLRSKSGQWALTTTPLLTLWGKGNTACVSSGGSTLGKLDKMLFAIPFPPTSTSHQHVSQFWRRNGRGRELREIFVLAALLENTKQTLQTCKQTNTIFSIG